MSCDMHVALRARLIVLVDDAASVVAAAAAERQMYEDGHPPHFQRPQAKTQADA